MVVVTGVRRSGKTTILIQFIHHLIESKNVQASQTLYANLEDPRLPVKDGPTLLDELMTAHQAFVDPQGLRYLILDEVQRLPEWERLSQDQAGDKPGSAYHRLGLICRTALKGTGNTTHREAS